MALGIRFSWRYTFRGIAVPSNVAVLMSIPLRGTDQFLIDPIPRLREQPHFSLIVACAAAYFAARPLVWQRRVFTWFSYIKPFMIHVSGFSGKRDDRYRDAW